MDVTFSRAIDKETQIPNGRYNVHLAGKKSFGNIYELSQEELEVLFVFLGDKINDIKGGLADENE